MSDYYTKSETSSNVELDVKFETKADLSAIPTKTSELTNDSEYVTAPELSAQLAVKRDITDMRARGVPQNTNSLSWFNIKYRTTTENAYYYDEGRWESGVTTRVYATSTSQVFELQRWIESQWTSLGTFSLDSNFEATITHEGVTYSITGYVGEIVTSNELPTKTSELTNDSGFITSADIIIKRDLNDLNIYIDPMAEHTPIEVTVWHTSEISTLYTLNWVGTSWYYTDDVTSIQIYFDDYSNSYILNGSIQDMGGTTRGISKSFDLTSPFWSMDFETQYFYKIEVASIKAHIVTREYVDSRLSALEARIAALEGN